MAAYVAGDRAAFAELFERYAPLLMRIMQGQLAGREDARDLVQQTFLHLHRSRNDFRASSQLRPWLLTIALNLKRRHLRRLGHLTELPWTGDCDDEMRPSSFKQNDCEIVYDVHVALSSLPADQREVIVLHWLEGLPFNEVAQVVGASLSAVKVRAHRGYFAIRKIFDANESRTASRRNREVR
jgi:RNA polymerase sigma factor (sigma-70 family)